MGYTFLYFSFLYGKTFTDLYGENNDFKTISNIYIHVCVFYIDFDKKKKKKKRKCIQISINFTDPLSNFLMKTYFFRINCAQSFFLFFFL